MFAQSYREHEKWGLLKKISVILNVTLGLLFFWFLLVAIYVPSVHRGILAPSYPTFKFPGGLLRLNKNCRFHSYIFLRKSDTRNILHVVWACYKNNRSAFYTTFLSCVYWSSDLFCSNILLRSRQMNYIEYPYTDKCKFWEMLKTNNILKTFKTYWNDNDVLLPTFACNSPMFEFLFGRMSN